MLFKVLLVAAISSVLTVQASPVKLAGRASLAQVITSCTKPQTAALTFDDVCPIPLFLRILFQLISFYGRVLIPMSMCVPFFQLFCPDFLTYFLVAMQDISKQLIAAGAKGTFFFNGNNCELQ